MKRITDLYKSSFIKAVITANKEIHTYLNTKLTQNDFKYTNTIGYGGDKSLNMDIIAENIFIKYLSNFGNIYSEECGKITNNKEFNIIIDPLDGSDNFSNNLPYYGTSVALQSNGNTIAGFVCNLSTSILTYKAFDSELIRLSLINEENNHFYNKDKKIGIFERAYAFPEISKKLFDKKIKFRSPGALALSLCNAKDYDFVLFMGDIREFDIAASLYICNALFIYKTNKFLLISENKQKFSLIKEIIKQ
jgi:myo-inositol-1(or 4)-monophosphatase